MTIILQVVAALLILAGSALIGLALLEIERIERRASQNWNRRFRGR